MPRAKFGERRPVTGPATAHFRDSPFFCKRFPKMAVLPLKKAKDVTYFLCNHKRGGWSGGDPATHLNPDDLGVKINKAQLSNSRAF
jgi:hypothetical protein